VTKKTTILVEVISTLGALASILWLFLDPGPEPFAASLVCLAAILGTAVQAQVKLAKIQDEALTERLNSIREIIRVVDNIPRVSADGLFRTLDNDKEFRNSLIHRLVRLFGLRRELIPYVEPELITMIDDEFEKFFVVRAGSYNFRDEKLQEFAIFSEKLSKTVREIEKQLIEEHRKRVANE
jgi:hypothetical protein